MTLNKWLTEKPDFDQECLLTTATCLRGKWSYDSYKVEQAVEDEGAWYLRILTLDGYEWGDIADLHADKYYVMELLK